MTKFCTTLLLLLTCALPALAEREWLMTQKQAYTGFHKIYFTRNAIKIQNDTLGYSVVSKAPDWKVTAFRFDDKVTRSGSLRQYLKEQQYDPDERQTSNSRYPKIGTTKVAGLTVTEYATGKRQDSYVWLIEDAPISREICDVLLGYYQLAHFYGLIYGANANYAHRAPKQQEKLGSWSNSPTEEESVRRDLVKTESLKIVPYKSSDFDCPKGFKTVATNEDIMTGHKQKQDVNSMFDDLGVGSKLGK